MTMRVARTLLILCALPVLGACGCGKKPHWPLAPGNEWVYQEHLRTGSVPTGDVRYVVDSVTGGGAARRAHVLVFRNDAAEPVQEIEFAMTADGIYESGRRTMFADRGSGAAVEERTVTPGNDNAPFLLLARPAAGQTWSFSFTRAYAGDGPAWEYTGRGVVDRKESVAPVAGRFKALRVTWTAARRDGSDEESVTYWFVPGVGPVKIDTRFLGDSTVLMLRRAKIGKKKIGKW